MLKVGKSKLLLVGAILAVSIIIGASIAFAADGEGDTNTTTTDNNEGLKAIAAGLAVGIAGVGAAIGLGMAASAAIGAIVESPEVFGKAFLFIVLIEAIAIYGLLIAILLVL